MQRSHTGLLGFTVIVVAAGLAACQRSAAESATASVRARTPKQAGEYLVRVGSCNDCHTPGWEESDGTLPTSEWLTGSGLGWRGPWGTTYPSNLRLSFQNMTEDQWVNMARVRNARPPMPWVSVRALSERDLRAIYRFIVGLGPAGTAAPSYVPPDRAPPPPYVTFPAEPMM